MKKKLLRLFKTIILAAMMGNLSVQGQVANPSKALIENKKANPDDPKMQWWKEARFGMFIHWGIYAVPAGTHQGKKINGIGEWIMNKGKIPVEEYKKYASQFNPQQFNAEEWVKLAKDAGMKYIVITSKHHDGFAMFKSSVDPFNIYDATPFKRDPIKELSEACKKYGIKFGLYYSQAQDWTAPGGSAIGGHWDSVQNGSMKEYIEKKAVPQIKEILSNYGKISVLWFDTPTGMTKEYGSAIMEVLKNYPDLIYNNRLGGGYDGDLETPEQYIPPTGYPGRNWESCMTMNDTWGFKSDDNKWKSATVLIHNMIDIASKGGNYLLNVGPTAEGIIPEASVMRLKTVGAWMKKYGDAIYNTTSSPFAYLNFGRCTKRNNTLFFHVLKWPSNGIIKVPFDNKITKAYILGSPNKSLPTKFSGKYTQITLPATQIDSIATVIAVELDKPANITVAEPIPSLKKTYSASSTNSPSNIPDLAFDGTSKKNWMAADTAKSAWIAVDLGKPYSIGSISMTEAGTFDKFAKKFKLEYKEGNEWKTVFEGTTIGAGYFNSFKPVIAREFRVTILESSKTPQLKFIQLYFDEE